MASASPWAVITLALSDPLYAQRVFVYITDEINKSTTDAKIDDDDLNVPRQESITKIPQHPPHIPQPRPRAGPVVAYTPRPTHTGQLTPLAPAPVQMNGYSRGGILATRSDIYPLKYKGMTVQGRDTKNIFYDIFYSFNAGTGISLLKYDHTHQTYTDLHYDHIKEMFTGQKNLLSDTNGQKLYFGIDNTRNELTVYQLTDSNFSQIESIKLIATPPQSANTNSNVIISKKSSVTPPVSPINKSGRIDTKSTAQLYQLMYKQQNIQVRDADSDVFYEILFTFNSDGRMDLFKFNRQLGTKKQTVGALIREMYARGSPMKSPTDSRQLYFMIDTVKHKLIIMKQNITTGMYDNIETVSM